MSGIPVRKDPVTDSRKIATSKDKVNGSSQTSVASSRLEKKRFVRKKSEEEELRDENIKLRSEKASKQNTIWRLEQNVEKLQKKISDLNKCNEEKENTYKVEIDSLHKEKLLYEQQIESSNKKLLQNNINPVTLDPLEPDEEQAKLIKERQLKTKENVQVLKNRIEDFNQISSDLLQEIKNIGEELDQISEVESPENT